MIIESRRRRPRARDYLEGAQPRVVQAQNRHGDQLAVGVEDAGYEKVARR